MNRPITLTYAFSSILMPFMLKTLACVSKWMAFTHTLSIVWTRLVVVEPVAVSFVTRLIVVDRSSSSIDKRLYACHMSSGRSAINVTLLRNGQH
jgi:hypothetical protein